MRYLSFMMFFFLNSFFLFGKTYYVDPQNGNDDNDGLSLAFAWRSVDKINGIRFEPGDEILLKRGEVFPGGLRLHGSGRAGAVIRLGAYGTGHRPVIEAGTVPFAIALVNEEQWVIEDVETTGATMAGIFIGCSREGATLSHFRITNCDVHDVGDDRVYTYEGYSTLTGGIVVVNGSLIDAGNPHGDNDMEPVTVNSIINDVIIDGCTVRYIRRWTCISITSGVLTDVKGNGHSIRNCAVAYSVADGIRMNNVRNSIIGNCTLYKNGAWPERPNKDWGGLGAWFFNADSCTIQFCEASHVDSPRGDGGAFDIDYWQSYSTIQYCYGHDCHGYGASIFGADPDLPTVNSTIRYNIFSNNARDTAYAWQGDFFVFTWNGGLLDGVRIYNNTCYWNPGANAPALNADADFTGTNPNFFKNNIIYGRNPWFASLKNTSLQCDNNIYWTASGKGHWSYDKKDYYTLESWRAAANMDGKSMVVDPQLKMRDYHGMGMPGDQFKFRRSSPAIDAGADVGEMGDHDFFGNLIPDPGGKFDIGAFEFNSTKN